MSAALLCLLLSQYCARIDYSVPPPNDFPKFEIRVHEYDGIAAGEACRDRYLEIQQETPQELVACSELNFKRLTCTIHVPKGNDYLLTYEKARCAGYGNPGERRFVEVWQAWKQLSEAK